MNACPIYIIDGAVYRFEQVIDRSIELFNSHLQRSVMIREYDFEFSDSEFMRDTVDKSLDIDMVVKSKKYTVINWI